MTTIETTNGVLVVIDSEYHDQINQYSWYLKKSNWCYYACRSMRIGHRIKTVRLHRYVWELKHGSIPDGHDVHHVDSDTLDCRIEKLEAIEHTEHGYLRGV